MGKETRGSEKSERKRTANTEKTKEVTGWGGRGTWIPRWRQKSTRETCERDSGGWEGFYWAKKRRRERKADRGNRGGEFYPLSGYNLEDLWGETQKKPKNRKRKHKIDDWGDEGRGNNVDYPEPSIAISTKRYGAEIITGGRIMGERTAPPMPTRRGRARTTGGRDVTEND